MEKNSEKYRQQINNVNEDRTMRSDFTNLSFAISQFPSKMTRSGYCTITFFGSILLKQ